METNPNLENNANLISAPGERGESNPFLESIREAIAKSPARIQNEYEKNDNPWLACFVTDLHGIGMLLDMAKNDGEIDVESYNKELEKLKIIGHVVAWLQGIFLPIRNESGELIDRDGGLPDVVKKKLQEDLKNLSV